MGTVKPREATPSLEVDTIDGGRFSLGDQDPEAFTMVVFLLPRVALSGV